MRCVGLLLALAIVPGCGPAVGAADGSDDESGATGTSAGNNNGGDTGAGSTSTQTTSTGATSASTTAPGTTTTSGDPTTTNGSTGGTSGQTPTCEIDRDCMLVDDCCECWASPVGTGVPCDADCAQSECSFWGIDTARCRFGVCTVERLRCNPIDVFCAALAPLCEAGFSPEVEAGCWSGRCVPNHLCDWVPDCASCLEGEVCVHLVGGPMPVTEQRSCEPIPYDCDGLATCDCAGPLVCEGVGSCDEPGEGTLTCVGQ